MENHPTRSPDSGVHESAPVDALTERDLTDLHEDILDENEENVRHMLRDIAEDGLSVAQLCHTELQVEPLGEDHPLNSQALSALHRAALLDSNSILTLLLTSANNIDANLPLKATGYTPLHVASLAGIPAAASYLAFNGAKVDVKDHKGQTPIHLCAKNGHADIAKVLVVKGGHIECVDSKKRTPLHYACKEGELKFVHFLLKKNVVLDVVDDKGWTALHCAVSRGNLEVAEVLLSNCPALLNLHDHQGNTALHVLLSNADRRKNNVLCGNFDECLSLLLSAKDIDYKKRNLREETPLHYSVNYGYNKATEELLTKGVDVNALDVNQESPIFKCVSTEALKMLLKQPDVDLSFHNYAGETVLHRYAKTESITCPMLAELLDQGAEIDACNSQNETALHLACQKGFTNKVAMLLEQGASCSILDCAGQSILQAAIENGHSSLAKTLVNNNCVNVDVQNKKGQSALHMAILFQLDEDLIGVLTKKTTKLSLPDEYGLFPADYAVRKCDKAIAGMLLRKKAELLRTNSTFLLTFQHDEDLEIVQHLQSLGFNTGMKDSQGRSLLHLAIENKAWCLVEHLVQTNARCDLTDNAGNTPLHYAALHCHSSPMIDDLVTNSTSINKRNAEGLSPLHNAAMNEYVDILNMLLLLGAKVDAQDKQMRTAFHICGEILVNKRGMEQESAEQKIEVLLDHIESGDPEIHFTSSNGRQIVHYVCEAGFKALTQMCIRKGAKLDKGDERGMTPLHYASGCGNPGVVTLLLNHGASLEALDFQGQTPLYHAVEAGHEDAVELLLVHRANVNHQRLADQATALHLALEQNKRRIAEALLRNAPDVNLLNAKEQCVLHLASQYGNCVLMKACLELNPNKRQRDFEGREAMHYAVFNDDIKVMSMLLANGCPVDPVDNVNNTPLLLSSKKGSYEHMSLLVESHADVNHKNAQSACPVHYAQQHDETDLLELLIANEADLDVQSVDGRTPLIQAIASNDLDSAQLLLDQGVDLKLLDNAGNSALHHVLHTHSKVSIHFLRTLSRRGCDFHLANIVGVTPLDLLKKREDVNVEEIMQMFDLD